MEVAGAVGAGLLEAKESAARERVEQTREEAAGIAAVLEEAERALERLVIAREVVVEVLSEPAARAVAVRFDLRRGRAGMAFVAATAGSFGMVVVDLATGHSWRRLAGDLSASPDEGFVAVIDGRSLPNEFGTKGIALGANGKHLRSKGSPARASPSPYMTPDGRRS